jgi:hypothetical protein
MLLFRENSFCTEKNTFEGKKTPSAQEKMLLTEKKVLLHRKKSFCTKKNAADRGKTPSAQKKTFPHGKRSFCTGKTASASTKAHSSLKDCICIKKNGLALAQAR